MSQSIQMANMSYPDCAVVLQSAAMEALLAAVTICFRPVQGEASPDSIDADPKSEPNELARANCPRQLLERCAQL